jgi:ABC-type proline/glycine betaine transport system permease subunit
MDDFDFHLPYQGFHNLFGVSLGVVVVRLANLASYILRTATSQTEFPSLILWPLYFNSNKFL